MQMPEGYQRLLENCSELSLYLDRGIQPIKDVEMLLKVSKEMAEVLEELNIESVNHDDNSLSSKWIEQQTGKVLNKFKEWK